MDYEFCLAVLKRTEYYQMDGKSVLINHNIRAIRLSYIHTSISHSH